jgi:hypothetical protein
MQPPCNCKGGAVDAAKVRMKSFFVCFFYPVVYLTGMLSPFYVGFKQANNHPRTTWIIYENSIDIHPRKMKKSLYSLWYH